MSEALLDLVCGPAGPLPETYQRYRLVQHLGTGGQAEVYRAVRLSGGVSSAPVTVKVFRVAADRPMADQMRSWDEGDAVLMDLNSRGVPGICRRADGFYGPPPHAPGAAASPHVVPYQVLDYLHGVNLRDFVAHRTAQGGSGGGSRLSAATALGTLAAALRAMHLPGDAATSAVLHMDVKPSNVMVLANGDVRLIDFTSARYRRRDHITSVAYTAESGGPEAFTGDVGPAYDVHGFGAVAYYLVTGALPRGSAAGDSPDTPPWSVLRRHPLLDSRGALRDHLLAPLADRPEDRPGTADLASWTGRLCALVRSAPLPDVGVTWEEPARPGVPGPRTPRVVGRAGVPARPLTGTEQGAFPRIEKLERELVELRAVLGTQRAGPPVSPAGSPSPGQMELPATLPLPSGGPVERAGPAGATQPAPRLEARGVAAVQRPQPAAGPPEQHRPPAPRSRIPSPGIGVLARGWELSAAGALFTFVCWGIWAFGTARSGLGGPVLTFVFVLGVAVGVFAMCRLFGRLVWARLLGRIRYTARPAHAVTALFLIAAGADFLGKTPWFSRVSSWLSQMG